MNEQQGFYSIFIRFDIEESESVVYVLFGDSLRFESPIPHCLEVVRAALLAVSGDFLLYSKKGSLGLFSFPE